MNGIRATGNSQAEHFSINYGGRLVDLSSPVVMGILNVTPDSFYDGGKFTQESFITERITKMLEEGAGIIDIGGASSRPGSDEIPLETEWLRVKPVFEIMRKQFPDTIISVDTWRAGVVKRVAEQGPVIVNDISGGTFDAEMYNTVAHYQLPYILMHIRGNPGTMQNNPEYDNVTFDILKHLLQRAASAQAAGVKDIILDPGFGFGKTTAHNYQLMQDLNLFTGSGFPILAGLSRKGMISRLLNINSSEALNGTTVLHTIALLKGVKILRVHDVKEAKQTIQLIRAMMNPGSL